MAITAAAISVALQVLGAGNSIAGGIKAKKEARDAERAAKSAMEQARKNIELNQYQAMQVPTDAFDLASRGITAGQMQATSALQEAGGRALLGGLGRVQAAGIQGQEAQRQMMQKALMDREKLIADQQTAIDQRLAAMSINQALGAQERLREREMAANKMIGAGVQGLGSAAVAAIKNSKLYKEQEGLDADPIDTSATEVLGDTAQNATDVLEDNNIIAPEMPTNTPQMDILSALNQIAPFLMSTGSLNRG